MKKQQMTPEEILNSIMEQPDHKWEGIVVGIIVTPQIAETWLQCNVHDRTLMKTWATRLTQAIKRGEWMFSPAMIAFDSEGRLIDGQHRLKSIVDSGRAVPCIVGWGFDPECFKVIDCGTKRTFASSLSVDRVPHYNLLASAYGLLFKYLNNSSAMTGGGIAPTSVQLHALMKEHPKMSQSVSTAYNGWKLVSVGTLAFCHYLFSQKDMNHANAFMHSFITGANLQEGSPVLRLRYRMELNRASKEKLSTREIIALIFKAWNHERTGRCTVPFLRWSEGAGEKFPEVL